MLLGLPWRSSGIGRPIWAMLGDEREALRARLDAAQGEVDAILTQAVGLRSAGDEDTTCPPLPFRSRSTGSVGVSRSRPAAACAALALWAGHAPFCLPVIPVAAMVLHMK